VSIDSQELLLKVMPPLRINSAMKSLGFCVFITEDFQSNTKWSWSYVIGDSLCLDHCATVDVVCSLYSGQPAGPVPRQVNPPIPM